MPSKEDVCVVQESLPSSFLSSDVEELVAAIKHNLQLKSRPSNGVYSKQKRVSPYSAPVRSVCRNKDSSLATEHSHSNCKYCILKSKASAKTNTPEDPYEILTLLSKGILINEAVRRLQRNSETNRSKNIDFYDSSEELEAEVENM